MLFTYFCFIVRHLIISPWLSGGGPSVQKRKINHSINDSFKTHQNSFNSIHLCFWSLTEKSIEQLYEYWQWSPHPHSHNARTLDQQKNHFLPTELQANGPFLRRSSPETQINEKWISDLTLKSTTSEWFGSVLLNIMLCNVLLISRLKVMKWDGSNKKKKYLQILPLETLYTSNAATSVPRLSILRAKGCLGPRPGTTSQPRRTMEVCGLRQPSTFSWWRWSEPHLTWHHCSFQHWFTKTLR